MSVKMRREVERKIVSAVIKSALLAGYEIGIDNGGDEYECKSTDYGTLMKAIMATDDEHLYFHAGPNIVGWVYFVYGNDGWDVLSDYTTNLEEMLKPAHAIADSYAD